MLNNKTWVASPLEQFEVTNFIGISAPIMGINISLTNLGFYSLLAVILIISFHLLASNNQKLIPNNWSLSLESSYASLHSMVKEQIGSSNEKYLPFIYSLFFFLIISNLNGNIPYSYTIGTSAIFSLGLSMTVFLGVTLLSIHKHKLHFFSYFVPSGTPLGLVPLLVLIELISYIARAFSLGIRLFANLVSGHTLLAILSGFIYSMIGQSVLITLIATIPLILFVAIVGLEIAVSLIQAFVFTVLTSIYLRDALELH